MEPEEITEENWVQRLAEFLNPNNNHLTVPIRECLSLEGQSAMRTLRDTLPQSKTVRTVEEQA